MLNDLRYAIRYLRRSKGFALAAILTLALGIGANTAIFSVVNGVVLRPLPYNNPDELVMIWAAYPERGWTGGSMSHPDARSIQAEARSLRTTAGYHTSQLTVTGLGDAESIPGARVTDGLLEVFQERPALGRDIRREEDVPNGPRVVLVGHAFWQERLGGDVDVLGKTLMISGEPYEIVGVAPHGFDYPSGALLWIPRYHDSERCNRDCHFLRVIARVENGVTVETATEEVLALSRSLEERFPVLSYGKRFSVQTLEDRVIGNVRPALLILLGSVGLVLLIACANVANLLLARSSVRAGEIAMRSALGATRGRLIYQLMLEAAVLALAASLLGIVLARIALSWLLTLAPATIPRLDSVALDSTVILFAIGTAVFITVIFGLTPALRLSATNVAETIGQGGRSGTGGRARDRARSTLLVAEVALSLMLLFGAGVLLRSFSKLSTVDLGFQTENVLSFRLSLPRIGYDPDGAVRFFENVEREVRALPGVSGVGSIYGSPLTMYGFNTSIHFLDRPALPEGQEINISVRVVTPGFRETLRIPLLRGRAFESNDRDGSVRAAMVSQSLATQYYPTTDPIGKEIRIDANLGYGDETAWTIVGVVGDIRSQQIAAPPGPEIYVPHAQMGSGEMTVHVLTSSAESNLLPAVRQAVSSIDANVPLRNIEMLEERADRQLGPTRFYTTLLLVFAAVAALLAAIGLYGVVAYLVAGRTREIGIRMALGAKTGHVLRLILLQGIRPAALGVLLGIVGAVFGSRVIRSLLYEVEPGDPITLAGVTLVLLAVVLLAILIPARKASHIPPVEALRRE